MLEALELPGKVGFQCCEIFACSLASTHLIEMSFLRFLEELLSGSKVSLLVCSVFTSVDETPASMYYKVVTA